MHRGKGCGYSKELVEHYDLLGNRVRNSVLVRALLFYIKVFIKLLIYIRHA